jgi:hypothetical protein
MCLAASGCGAAAAKGSSPAGASATTDAAVDLTTQVLTASDLPAGWVADRSPFASALAGSRCMAAVTDTTDSLVNQYQFWHGPSGEFPNVAEVVGYYLADGYGSPSAHDKYLQIVRSITTCGTIHVRAGSVVLAGTIGPLQMAQVGQESAAWASVMAGTGHRVNLDVLVARKGNSVFSVIYADQTAGAASATEPSAASGSSGTTFAALVASATNRLRD